MNLSRLPPAERKRIRMETEILAELNHDHIINFYHVWENKEKGQTGRQTRMAPHAFCVDGDGGSESCC